MTFRLTLPPDYTVIRKGVVESTNDEARLLALSGAPDRTVVCAESQTAGRGRRGRRWISPKGNLYFSILLRPQKPAGEMAQLSLVAALGLSNSLGAFVDRARVRHKWPNDILIDGKKVAGMLLESSGRGAAIDWVVVGCGVNIENHPDDVGYPVIDLDTARGSHTSPDSLLGRFLPSFETWYGRWLTEGAGPVCDAWLSQAQGVGKEIVVRLPDRELRGIFEGLDDAGALRLALPDGRHEVITAGDVFAQGSG